MSSSKIDFEALAEEIFKRNLGLSEIVANRRFRGLFGVSAEICGQIWSLTQHQHLPGSQPRHLLWALLFLKSYANETVLSALTGADEKTQRLWIWRFIRAISRLDIVRLPPSCSIWELSDCRYHGRIGKVDLSIIAGQV